MIDFLAKKVFFEDHKIEKLANGLTSNGTLERTYCESINLFKPRLHGCFDMRHVMSRLSRFIWQHENRTHRY